MITKLMEGIGETRTSLIGRNHAILSSCISDMKPFKENAILLIVANPVDVLTYFAQKLSGLPRSQVLGT
jgi:L-lactate dehydrogenase